MNTPPRTFPGWPHFDSEDMEAARGVLASGRVNYWTGEEGKLFEKEMAAFLGVPHAIALANGTVALEVALRALGVGPGDEVVVTPRTFVATASAVLMCGARPVFADVDRASGNLTAATIAPALTPHTKVVIPVHMAGWPCDMDPIMELARQKGLKVIEDCAQALGAEYKGRPIGSLGDIGAFSFCQDKIVTTGGEGGLVATRHQPWWEFMWSFKDHGKNYDTVFNQAHPPGFRWLHESTGTNWRMTELQSAVGRSCMKKLPQWLAARRQYADILDRRFAALPGLEVLRPPPEFRHAYYKYYVNVRPDQLQPGWDRDRILAELSALKIPCFAGTCCEIYREKVFIRLGLQPAQPLPNAAWLSRHAIMFQVHPTLSADDIRAVADAVESVLRKAVRAGDGGETP